MKTRVVLSDEWLYVIKVDTARHRCVVECHNPGRNDRAFAAALARVIKLWIDHRMRPDTTSQVRECPLWSGVEQPVSS